MNAQVRGHTLMATVDTGCVQSLVHTTTLPTQASTPTRGKILVCVHGRQQTYKQCQLTVTVLGRTYKMSIGITCDLPCPMLLGRAYVTEVLQSTLTGTTEGRDPEILGGFAEEDTKGPLLVDREDALNPEDVTGSGQF